ncbi:MAG TPA: tetratricopeptide repeat protein [Verrucomicrobiae bacterium]|nr:tetratricopeptide repeat protein [Verrucomicrobiae bacterium]
MALLLPLLGLGLFELGLRVGGYGHPTGFFLKANDGGRAMLKDNPWFGWRFFPPAVARAPRPLYLSPEKPPNTVRVFVFGESAAMGDPEPAYGFARQLERLLQARHPGQRIEVINAAMTAINSHVIREIARDCAPRAGDFWVVYAGNNEVIGPFGAGTIFGQQAPNRTLVRTLLALKATRLGQLFGQLASNEDEPKEWQGLEFFLKWRLPHDAPALKRVYASFGANLQDIVQFGKKSGATVLLATVSSNLRDFAPLASVHRAGLPPEQVAEWQRLFSAGLQAQAAGRHAEAVAEFQKAAAIDDAFAELAYQLARCQMELNQSADAAAGFRRARDLDALRFRADSTNNNIIREVAKANGISLADLDEELGPHAGGNLFYDHVHLNFAGNYQVALRLANEIEKHWPGGKSDAPWLSEADVARRLAYTAFDERRVGEEMRARMQQPPFNAQSNFRARDELWATTLIALAAAPSNAVPGYQAAIQLAPDDWILRANFARVLEASGDNAAAAQQWSEMSRRLPCSSEGWANQGRLARMAGQTQQARDFLAKALRLQPDSVKVLTESGILHASVGANEAARRDFGAALQLQPAFIAARVSLGLLLASEGNVAGATAEYHEALRWRTNNVEARINLANLLVAQGKAGEALTWFEQAVALEPDNAVARYNFGRLLAAQNRHPEAVTNFQVALQLHPDSGEIHFELANALTRVGRESEALPEFGHAVRLIPSLPEAHLNYGVALARAGQYEAAANEFRETLRLNPQDERAQRMLDQALRRAGR